MLRNNQKSKKKKRGLDRLGAKEARIGGAGSWEGITVAEGVKEEGRYWLLPWGVFEKVRD
jgi:hypothetical protein